MGLLRRRKENWILCAPILNLMKDGNILGFPFHGNLDIMWIT